MLMKNAIIALCALLAAHVPAEAQVVKTIDISDHKPLNECMTTEEALSIDSISVVGGRLYAEDFQFLVNCCEKGRLTGIDLSNSCSHGNIIPERAFMSSKINYIRLPRNVRHIGGEAFRNTELRMIELPRTVETVGKDAFGSCKDLREVVVRNPDGANINAAYAFDGGASAARLAVPAGCSGSYTSIAPWNKFGDTVEREGLYTTLSLKLDGSGLEAQLGDRLLTTDSLSLSGRLAADDFAALRRGISSGVLTGLDLSSCTVDGNVIPEKAFYMKYETFAARIVGDKLRHLTLPEGITVIGKYAFDSNRCLRSVNIPSTVTVIHEGAFSSCWSLASITVPEGVATLPWAAFKDCYSVSEVNLPSTLYHLGGCSLLLGEAGEKWNITFRVNCTFAPGLDLQNNESTFGTSQPEMLRESLKTCTLYVPVGAKPAYEADVWWSCFGTIIETSSLSGTTGISDAAPGAAAAPKSSGIYSLGGQYVGTDLNALGSGVYVVNGRKVVK